MPTYTSVRTGTYLYFLHDTARMLSIYKKKTAILCGLQLYPSYHLSTFLSEISILLSGGPYLLSFFFFSRATMVST